MSEEVRAKTARRKTAKGKTTASAADAAPRVNRTRKRTTKAKQVIEPPSEPVSPAPTPRRAVFIDVENTTAEAALLEVLRGLAIDPQRQDVEVTAVGNWRAVPPTLARRLASLGARLIHSAPARGVRDWSDLWIATAAGYWLGQARPGDVLEVVSNDRAFDAIGDLAAARGVTFRRIAHTRALTGATAPKESAATGASPTGGKHGGATPGPPEAAAHGASQAAPAEQIVATIERLTQGEPGRWVNLDVLERALKEQGFVRPPGSPRLVTRLRALKQVEVDAHGRVRIRVEPRAGETAGSEVRA
ncbi:MAG: hypothetical protein KatS3mg077_1983 [Candidatus Binatia bacterium]|nr:MAG: hypothetical protein KatS3mg077_1983 [Candidatus Binatia bacterium]